MGTLWQAKRIMQLHAIANNMYPEQPNIRKTHVRFSVISYSLHLIANKLPAGTYITYGMSYCSFDMFDSKKIGPKSSHN